MHTAGMRTQLST